MARHLNPVTEDEFSSSGGNIICGPKISSWLDLKVFYVRVSNCAVDKSAPDHLTLDHIPLTPDTFLEVNGRRSSVYSERVSSLLRRDMVDKGSQVATFVTTDSIRVTGSLGFEIRDRDDVLFSGVLELCNDNGVTGERRSSSKRWKMECQSLISGGGSSCFLKGSQSMSPETVLPTVDVYVAGCFSGVPVIMTKTLKFGVQKMRQMKTAADSDQEYETAKQQVSPNDASQLLNYEDFKLERDVDVDYNSIYPRSEYNEWEEDGELSWFNAGVRVGVGLSLGIFLGVGVGIGLLVQTYQTTAKTFKRRFI